MQLSVFERLVLLNILPREGDFLTLKILRKLKEDLSFSEEEHKVLQFKHEGNAVRWNQDADVMKDIAVGEKATDIVVGRLKELDNVKKLTENHMTLYEKFVEGG